MKKFTFKTNKATGKYRAFEADEHLIKYNKIACGYFTDSNGFKAHLQVIKKDINEDGNPNCPWKWIHFKKEHKTLKDAKEWINTEAVRNLISNNFELFLEE